MASKTIKYSKTDPTGTTTTNVFENFEPWRYGEPAIPTELYFLGAGGNGYQQYFNTNGYGVQEVNAVGSDSNQLFQINGKPIRGCVKGTVVTAKELLRGQSDVEIWVEDGKVYYQTSNDSTKTELTITDGIIPKRLGIALVGGGGASGEAKTENWKNNCCNFNTTMPGGGGGGGGIVWGIINLEKSSSTNKYVITVGSGGAAKGADGQSTVLWIKSTDKGIEKVNAVCSAIGGRGGSKGSRKGADGGEGGAYWATSNRKEFILCGCYDSASLQGGSYAEVNENGNSDSQYIGSIVNDNKFKISFVPNSGEVTGGSDQHKGIGTTVEDMTKANGAVYLTVPGGNSFGNGGYQEDEMAEIYAPTYGGGGMCWTHRGANIENIWDDTSDKAKKARCGADGGWILFY